jgi:hypothetical protein
MTCIRMKPLILSAVLALLASDVQAWTSPMKTSSIVRTSFGKSVLGMAEGDQDKVQLTSGRKEILFDDKSGRFYETNRDTEECIPDEEFCTIDDETGQRIRLTIAEKERIFLDSLQVSRCEEAKELGRSLLLASNSILSTVLLRERPTIAA